MTDLIYAGDKTPQESWDILKTDPRAALVDCRTEAEWTFVGVPVIDELGKSTMFIEWLSYPSMAINGAFAETVSAHVTDKDNPILFLCRSGQRSQAAAASLTALGYSACYNILEGFEGDKDDEGCRGGVGGWRCTGLPWRNT